MTEGGKEWLAVCFTLRCGKRLRNTAAYPRMNQKQQRQGGRAWKEGDMMVEANDDACNDDECQLDVLPPEGTFEAGCLMLESRGAFLEAFSLVDEKIDLLATFDDLLDVALHELLDLVDLLCGLGEFICIRVGREEVHLSLQNMAELCVHRHRQRSLSSAAIS